MRLLLLATALTLTLTATAQDDTLTATLYEWNSVSCTWEEDGESGTDDEILEGKLRVSNNGQWAVGSCEDYPYVSYLVDINNDCTLIYLNDITGERANKSIANDVSDDGLIVGAYINSSNLWTPGYRTATTDWQPLPYPTKSITDVGYYETWSNACSVKRVSPDGTILLGQFPCYDTATYDDGTTLYFYYWEPCLWILDSDHNVTELREFYGINYRGQGFIPWDMSNDGTTIVGMAETQRGDQCPALLTNNTITYIKSPTLIAEEGYDSVWYEEGYEDGGAFWTGRAVTIDSQNSNSYYYKNGSATINAGIWNTLSDERTEYEGHHVSSAIPGLILGMEQPSYGPAIIIEGDQNLSDLVSQIVAPSSLSDDGRIIAGANIIYTDDGYAYNTPAMIVFSQSPLNNINNPQSSSHTTTTQSAKIYSLSGAQLAQPTPGITIQRGKKVLTLGD